jgi:hypothetical protein
MAEPKSPDPSHRRSRSLRFPPVLPQPSLFFPFYNLQIVGRIRRRRRFRPSSSPRPPHNPSLPPPPPHDPSLSPSPPHEPRSPPPPRLRSVQGGFSGLRRLRSLAASASPAAASYLGSSPHLGGLPTRTLPSSVASRARP